MTGHYAVEGANELEVAPGFKHEQLQGWVPRLDNEEELRAALEKAFDYRGDILVTRKDGTMVDGYLYDRRSGRTLVDSLIRILPSDGTSRVNIAYGDVAALKFSDRDPAAGKSWEAWVRKYWEKKAAGQRAEIVADNL